MNAVLNVRNLNVKFKMDERWVPVVEEVSFNLIEGRVLGIVGESGCGKSVTLKSLMGMIGFEGGKVSADELEFENENLLSLSEKKWQKLRGSRIAMIFQDPMASLNPLEKVGKQVVEVFTVHKLCTKNEAKKRVIQLFTEVGIPYPAQRFDQYPHELSGGMLQRVVIAMALAPEPKLILADEPTTALDVTLQKQILLLLKDLQKRKQMTMVFITHDLGVLKEIADDILVLYAGRQVERIPAGHLFERARHPYTCGLIKSLPNPFAESELYSIPGRVKSPQFRSEACEFADRCEKATEICHRSIPEWKAWGENHEGACYHA